MSRGYFALLGALAISVLAIPALAGGADSTGASSSLAARWEGTVQVPGEPMRLIVDLAQNDQGKWIGSAIIPGFNVKGVALGDLEVDGSQVSFAMKGVLGNPKVKGQIDAFGNLKGELQQAGNFAPFTLDKTGPPRVEMPPQSTPVRKELEGEWQGDIDLSGRILHVKMTLANQSSGQAAAKFHIKGKNDYDIPVDLVTEQEDLLTIQSPAAHFIYEGWIRNNASELSGELQLGPYDVSLVMHPAGSNASAQKPPVE